MKQIVFAFLFILSTAYSFAQRSGEMVMIRVEYAKKTSGTEHRITLDVGTSSDHSLAKKVTQEKGIVRIQGSEKVEVFTNEVDLLNYLNREGFRLFNTFQQTIMGETYQVYLMMRP